MLSSMTGFSRCTREADWGRATFEIRAVNHRFLEISFKWPDWCRGLEDKAREIIKNKVLRGKIDIYLHWHASDTCQPSLSLNTELVRKINEMIKAASIALPNVTVNVMEILNWPEVVQRGQWQTAQIESPLLALLDETVLQLVVIREQEGVALAKIIKEKITSLMGLIAKIVIQAKVRQAQVREKFLKQIDELKQVQSDRLEQELVFFLHRLDISEELDRLNAHSAAVLLLLQKGGQVGRRLDFLMQELGREANTLSSKSGDNIISELAIDIKVLIEQMREQIQNIE